MTNNLSAFFTYFKSIQADKQKRRKSNTFNNSFFAQQKFT